MQSICDTCQVHAQRMFLPQAIKGAEWSGRGDAAVAGALTVRRRRRLLQGPSDSAALHLRVW